MGSSLAALNEPLRSAVEGMIAEAGPGRITWTSTRRTRAEQAALRIKNGCPDVYDSPAGTCRIPTARPGESRHESGDAIDFTNSDAVLAEVARLAPKYGLQRTVPGEPWHYEHKSTSTLASDAGSSTTPAASSTSSGGAGGVIGALRLLTAGATWVRILQVLGGLALAAAGVGLIINDAKTRLAAPAVKLAAVAL